MGIQVKNKNKLRLAGIAAATAALLAGCATQSDTLGMTEDESTKTYAQAYDPARQMLIAGEFEKLHAEIEKNSANLNTREALTNEEEKERLIAKQSSLAIVERGLLALNVGDLDRALFYFDAAEEKLNLADEQTGVDSAAARASSWGKMGLSAVIGAEEISDYDMRGYEKVMLLNYKALCYMLKGDRRAYNVTRRAIDQQQIEWEKFKELLAKNEAADDNMQADVIQAASVDDRTDEVKAKAKLVSSAYVNPFGDYLNALMMEMDGFDDPTMRENARIAYSKVVENNKDCSAARAAVKNVRKGVPAGTKMVQVILADGFAPIRVEKTTKLELDKKNKIYAYVNYANAEPVDTATAKARVKVGGRTTTMSSLTKMESLVLRDEADRMPLRVTMFALALVKQIGAASFLGNLGTQLAAAVQRPDTRSWMTLPNQVHVARLVVPASQESISISTYDDKGTVLATEKVQIAKRGPSVVYAVSYGKNLKAYANSFSWVN